MKVITDNRGNESKYIDKDKYVVADNSSLIKLQMLDTAHPLYIACCVIAGINKLDDNERNLYYIICIYINDTKTVSIKELKAVFNKSESTFNRTINSLREKGIIYYTNEGQYIGVSNSYFIDKTNIENSKYLIIDFNTNLNL